MEEHMRPYADVLTQVSGPWIRGKAAVVTVPRTEAGGFDLTRTDAADGVKVVVMNLDEGRRSQIGRRDVYQLAKHARRAVRDLCALATMPADEADDAVVQFVTRHGLLYTPLGRQYLLNGADGLDFLAWCRQSGRPDDAAFLEWYIDQWQRQAPLLESGPHLVHEPFVLFLWAAQRLKAVQQELRAGNLTQATAVWLDRQLATLQLRYLGEPRRLTIEARTLLSYLAAQVVMDMHGWSREVTACEECGTVLPVERHGRQRFCSRTCQERHKKRRQRYQKRQQAMATGVANSVAN